MTAFLIWLGIVLTCGGLCIDWSKLFNELFDGFIVALMWLGKTAETGFYDLMNWLGKGTEKIISVIIVVPANYLNGYSYQGKHRQDNSRQSTDSEVDRWVGADDRFADFLHTMNLELHMNDQARA